ncbi:MAG: hypothetical protein CVV64_12260 [Candidatus Wallbacteria bacterium HGW-Wallbacteria-1]|jgi:hypothetical protein|uniref:Glycosyltransferase RgtA/B/C/D-like domain-containing protein n=1 Tax=Candidatus Wallbacteria bacterium HGW-Wallbacteria-1 TaxID=2013854 RepID=A0A2N1PNJ2_9BACT|nr:MAG: hypothetical protein CVV64_12260 [Candidatus Wallbacteria bacterium HGW-Wallbacteria-1]
MINRFFLLVLLLACGFLLLLEVRLSLDWPLGIDTSLIHYATTRIIDQGLLPYSQIFETSMPGTFALHGLFIELFGASASAFRIADLFFVALMMLMTGSLLSPFGKFASWGGGICFGLIYLGLGPNMSLQRDILGYSFVLTAVWTALRFPRNPMAGCLISGLFLGIASTVKPHLIIGSIPAIAAILMGPWKKKCTFRRMASLFFAALIFPGILCLVYLITTDTISSFLDMTGSYLPLHLSLNRWHEFMNPGERWPWILSQFLYVGAGTALAWWISSLFALGGIWLVSRKKAAKMTNIVFETRPLSRARARTAVVLALIWLCFWIYPVPAGKFWLYHWLPFKHACVMVSAMALWFMKEHCGHGSSLAGAVIVIAFMVVIKTGIPMEKSIALQAATGFFPAPDDGRPLIVSSYLKKHLRPGDTVQPLDWTRGVVHGLLLAKANLATSFMYDYHFYHHVHSPFIKALRERFMKELKNSRPRFIIETPLDKPWVSGPGTTREFSELRKWMAVNYHLVERECNLLIYERGAAQ